MNYKLEKFWNMKGVGTSKPLDEWTINLKSFEITSHYVFIVIVIKWTINLKSFEIANEDYNTWGPWIWTINLKSFEMESMQVIS